MSISILDSRALDVNYRYYHGSLRRLMENAGNAVALQIERNFPDSRKLLFVCGTGNKAGDAIQAASKLAGRNISIFFMHGEEKVKSEFTRRAIDELTYVRVDRDRLAEVSAKSDLIIDALLGTGLNGVPRADYAAVIKEINESGKNILSIDMPSGAGTPIQVNATFTVFLHDKKEIEHYRPGKHAVMDIGIPKELETTSGPGDFLSYPIPDSNSHKGMNGVVGMLAGIEYPGSAIIASLGAEGISVDLIHLYTSERHRSLISGYSPAIITRPAEVNSLIESDVAFLVGPGIGMNDENLPIMNKILSMNKPTVVDADGIKLLPKCTIKRRRQLILTPHSAEFNGLTGMPATEENAVSYAKDSGNIILLKGPVDIITDGLHTYRTPGGNPRMTMGGTGDLLAGIIAALLSKNIPEMNACRLGSFINKKVGENCFSDRSYWFTISDMIATVPEVMHWLNHFCYQESE